MTTSAHTIMLTTGKAAAMCGVTPDTVLKWIKSGKLKGTLTAGGHYRISRKNLAPFAQASPTGTPDVAENSKKIPCWEFNAQNGEINRKCRTCIVYSTKAEKCYILAALGRRAGHQKLFCESSCEKCRYFSYANGALKVLIISRKWESYKLCKTRSDCQVEILFACCGYEVSTIVSQFNPDAVLFDESLARPDFIELVTHLKNDSRLSNIRIFFITGGSLNRHALPREIDVVLKTPFSIPELKRGFFSFKRAAK